MSHFSVLVVTRDEPSDDALATILQPWHEYECTGKEDQYVVDVDITEKVKEQFEKPEKVVTLVDGGVLSRWDQKLYTKKKRPGDVFGRDEFELPGGATESEISAVEARKHGIGYATLAECAKNYFGAKGRNGRFYDRTNPNKKWDWWQLGGRWTGKLVPGYDPNEDPSNKQTCGLCGGTGKRLDMECANGCNGCNGTGIETKWPTQWKSVADRMQLKNIPVEALRDFAERKAATDYDAVHAVLAGRPVITWTEAVSKNNGRYDLAREEYNNQQPLKDLRSKKLCEWDGPDEYLMPRAKYLRLAREGAMAPFALVKDGQWYERGKMGWWATVSDEKDKEQWYAEFAKLIDGLPPETWLSIVDCHI